MWSLDTLKSVFPKEDEDRICKLQYACMKWEQKMIELNLHNMSSRYHLPHLDCINEIYNNFENVENRLKYLEKLFMKLEGLDIGSLLYFNFKRYL